jgi:O-antigen ligase
MNQLQQRVRNIILLLLLILSFSLPLSTSVVTVSALLIIGCWFIEGEFENKWNEIRKNPVCIAVLIYIGIHLAGLYWSHNFFDGFLAINKQWKIILLPVLITSIQWDKRWWYITSYISGVSCVMILVYLVKYGIIHYNHLDAYGLLPLIENQIVYTPMLAFATYILYHQVLWGKINGLLRWILLILAISMTCCVFMTKGRIGQVVFFVLMTLLTFQIFPKNFIKATLLTVFILPIIFISAYKNSDIFNKRVNLIYQNITSFERDPVTSIGLRLLFWKNSWIIINKSPWFGDGTGNFKNAYAKTVDHLSPVGITDNPHNQYILVTVQFGIFGLCGLLAIFLVQIYQSRKITDDWQRIRLAFPIFFLVIMTTDSYLNTHSSSFLFSLLSAIFFKKTPIEESGYKSLSLQIQKKDIEMGTVTQHNN